MTACGRARGAFLRIGEETLIGGLTPLYLPLQQVPDKLS
jgi:hypothetical protein